MASPDKEENHPEESTSTGKEINGIVRCVCVFLVTKTLFFLICGAAEKVFAECLDCFCLSLYDTVVIGAQ